MINGLKNQAKKYEFSPSPILGEGASTEEFYSQESAKLRRAGQELMKKKNSGLPWWPSGYDSAFQCRKCGFSP